MGRMGGMCGKGGRLEGWEDGRDVWEGWEDGRDVWEGWEDGRDVWEGWEDGRGVWEGWEGCVGRVGKHVRVLEELDLKIFGFQKLIASFIFN